MVFSNPCVKYPKSNNQFRFEIYSLNVSICLLLLYIFFSKLEAIIVNIVLVGLKSLLYARECFDMN